jgi:hypothetical protein
VGQPLHIVAVSVIFLAAYLTLRFIRPGDNRPSPWLLWAAIAWVAYALWEWVVLVATPQANIRFDLLLIWPVLAIVSTWALFRVLR